MADIKFEGDRGTGLLTTFLTNNLYLFNLEYLG
jgi:hypothetical protein